MKKTLVVLGTRPEAVKLCPLIIELKRRKIKTVVCSTGQHRELLDGVLEFFGVKPDYDLRVMTASQTPPDVAARVISGVTGVIAKEKPDFAVVQGDTSTAFAAACACFYAGVPLAHVEAGLRSGTIGLPFPEEFNRRVISLSAAWHFCPTPAARNNLIAEGSDPAHCFVTGNTGLDAFSFTDTAPAPYSPPPAAADKKLIYLTCHRRENRGEIQRKMLLAVKDLLDRRRDAFAVVPSHPDPGSDMITREVFAGSAFSDVTPPLDLVSSHRLIRTADLCVTDSGGLQEECAFAGLYCIVLRDVTERGEGTGAGLARLCGTDPEKVAAVLNEALDSCPLRFAPSSIYGDGHASERIADIIEKI